VPQRAITATFQDKQGNLWFGTFGAGLLLFKDSKFTRYTTADGLASNILFTFCQDSEDNIWVGTLDNGLIRITKQFITTHHSQNGLTADNTYPVYEDQDGIIWIGSWGGGLNKYQNGVFTHYTSKDGLPSDLVTSLFKDRQGYLWIGAHGILKKFKDGKFFHIISENDALSKKTVFAMEQDRDGALWLGTSQGLGRYKDGEYQFYTTKDGLPDDHVHAIREDRNGTIWIGTLGGLASFKNHTITSYIDKNGLSSNHIRSIYQDREGVLWIGSYDNGLIRLKDDRFTAYTIKDGLFDSGAFQILEDDQENLWISCNRGIYRVVKQELNEFAEGKRRSITSVAYGKKDGMLDQECNGGRQPAGCRARDGKFWFPTQKGVVVIDPKSIPINWLPPPVYIEEFSLNRDAISFHNEVLIPPGKDDFEIRFTGLSFTKPEQVIFKYQLIGLDKDWVEAGTRRSVFYTHLPPGNYTFKVIAANSDGIWNHQGATLHIVIIPPFWRTWWFLLGLLLSAIISATAFYRRRINQLEKARAAQEAFSQQLIDSQENERKRIASELHDGLGQNLLIIKNWALLALSLLPQNNQANEPLTDILSTASQSIDEAREIAYNLRPYQMDALGLTKALKSIVNRVSSSAKTSFISEIDYIDDLFPKEFEINIYRIVQESVNNIIKHSGASQAKIVIKRDEYYLRLTIEDNGKGFNPAMFTLSQTNKRGFGLLGIAERARMLGGNLELQAFVGQGTKISLVLKTKDKIV
jgi:signal transduction histidine kinase/ligand-binding sensor domain-containing protein